MKRKNVFSIKELAGGFGDLGTTLPIIFGYIVLLGIDPVGVFVSFGVIHIVIAYIYKIPLPVQPMKAISSLAFADTWNLNVVWGAGISMGVITLLLSFSDRISKFLDRIPRMVVYGLVCGLGIKLLLRSSELILTEPYLAIPLTLFSILVLSKFKVPQTIILLGIGFILVLLNGNLETNLFTLNYPTLNLHSLSITNIFEGLYLVSIVQLPLTLTNAVITTIALMKNFFPESENITSKKLLLNMGVINLLSPIIGGVPICHGSSGLSAHYVFGARTGGSIMMLGIMELIIGLFMSNGILSIINVFPIFILGIMLLHTSLELLKVIKKVSKINSLFIVVITAVLAVFYNMAIGLTIGMISHYLINRYWIIGE
jgi:MFS superfamily sulfate permease-like transporter